MGSRCAGALSWKWPGQLDGQLSEGRAAVRPSRPAERCSGKAVRRQGSGWCGLMACQRSMSSWKILYGSCRAVNTRPAIAAANFWFLQNQPSPSLVSHQTSVRPRRVRTVGSPSPSGFHPLPFCLPSDPGLSCTENSAEFPGLWIGVLLGLSWNSWLKP